MAGVGVDRFEGALIRGHVGGVLAVCTQPVVRQELEDARQVLPRRGPEAERPAVDVDGQQGGQVRLL